mmetsp:Transcript_27277/g.58613  ORF Transcript_27277/g.58613 Transcript_27277/m.58613 type:complete len:329 (-) Transcript_27277:258-1244(-)
MLKPFSSRCVAKLLLLLLFISTPHHVVARFFGFTRRLQYWSTNSPTGYSTTSYYNTKWPTPSNTDWPTPSSWGATYNRPTRRPTRQPVHDLPIIGGPISGLSPNRPILAPTPSNYNDGYNDGPVDISIIPGSVNSGNNGNNDALPDNATPSSTTPDVSVSFPNGGGDIGTQPVSKANAEAPTSSTTNEDTGPNMRLIIVAAVAAVAALAIIVGGLIAWKKKQAGGAGETQQSGGGPTQNVTTTNAASSVSTTPLPAPVPAPTTPDVMPTASIPVAAATVPTVDATNTIISTINETTVGDDGSKKVITTTIWADGTKNVVTKTFPSVSV